MYYEINVSKKGQHYFATKESSILDKNEALIIAKDLKMRFPETEGFEVILTQWSKVGKQVCCLQPTV